MAFKSRIIFFILGLFLISFHICFSFLSSSFSFNSMLSGGCSTLRGVNPNQRKIFMHVLFHLFWVSKITFLKMEILPQNWNSGFNWPFSRMLTILTIYMVKKLRHPPTLSGCLPFLVTSWLLSLLIVGLCQVSLSYLLVFRKLLLFIF